MASRIELPKFQAFDANGDPLSGGLVYTYAAGTSTLKTTYTDRDAGTPNANPVVLDSRGEGIIYGMGSYKLVLKTSDDVTVWTLDNVRGINETDLTSSGDYDDDFDAAITAIGATQTTLVIDSASTMSGVVTVPATCTVVVREGGSIDMGGNALTFNGPLIMQGGSFTHDATLTINKSFVCGLYDVGFDPDYTLSFAVGVVAEVYPQWWGALANGSQDDQPMCQAAINSLTRGTVRFVAGTYKLNTMQSFTSANTGTENGLLVMSSGHQVSIKGDGRDSSILDVTLDDTFYGTIVVNGANGVTIEDIAITGTGTAYSTNYGGGIRVLLSKDVVIKNCLFEDLRGIGINFVGNFLAAAGDTDLDYYCTNGIVDGNILRNVNGDGIYHVFSKRNSTINNILLNCGITDAIIYEASDHSTIANNVILYPNQRSIDCSNGSDYCTITGNVMYHAEAVTSHGAIILVDVAKCIISNNTIEYATGMANPVRAIDMYPGGSAIVSTYHKVSGNLIYNCGYDAAYPAIHIQTDYNTIDGNTMITGTYGITIDDASYNQVINNYIVGINGNGIRLQGQDGRDDPTYTYVSNNWVSSVSNGIYVGYTCENSTVVNNHTDTAMFVGSTTTNDIKGNVPDYETLTVAGAASVYKETTLLDSTAGGMAITRIAGFQIGQKHTFIMDTDGGDVTVSVANHRTSNPEVFYFREVGDILTIVWDGTYWNTVLNVGVETS